MRRKTRMTRFLALKNKPWRLALPRVNLKFLLSSDPKYFSRQERRAKPGTARSPSCWPPLATPWVSATSGGFPISHRRMEEVRHSHYDLAFPGAFQSFQSIFASTLYISSFDLGKGYLSLKHWEKCQFTVVGILWGKNLVEVLINVQYQELFSYRTFSPSSFSDSLYSFWSWPLARDWGKAPLESGNRCRCWSFGKSVFIKYVFSPPDNSLPGWSRLGQWSCGFQCGSLLQHHHRLVPQVFRQELLPSSTLVKMPHWGGDESWELSGMSGWWLLSPLYLLLNF